jgi:hypothetical protein
MITMARRLSVCVVLGGALLVGAAVTPATSSAGDLAYVRQCVPPIEVVGDLDCQYF